MTERGEIDNRGRSRQIRNYAGIRYGKITPTDIDGFFEIRDRVFVFFELKYEDAKMKRGQEVALERLVDTIIEPRKAILLIAKHNHPVNEDIDAANCKVVRYRWRGKWRPAKEGSTLKQMADRFVNWAMNEYQNSSLK